MPSKRFSIGWTSFLSIFTLALLLTSAPAAAQQVTVLYSFGADSADGIDPQANVAFDAAGNLYGTTTEGGTDSGGTVFELSPKVGGGWTEKILHNFEQSGGDGFYPYGGVIVDAIGNLYGTTAFGGASGHGTVFELTPMPSGLWVETVLHSFTPSRDGENPYAGLLMDSSGNLYGTAHGDGRLSGGTAFELSPNSSGTWTEKVLHNFNINGPGGAYPSCTLIFDAAGNLYGITPVGGNFGSGTAFELVPDADGRWSERLLHSFGAPLWSVIEPMSGVVFDPFGNLYGTSRFGGPAGEGTVYQVRPNQDGSWSGKMLYAFQNGTDGRVPFASLVVDAAGNLYGTTAGGGAYNWGTVFKLTHLPSGSWMETIVHSFNDDGSDGASSGASLILDAQGNLYGTTAKGGTNDRGTVFEITP